MILYSGVARMRQLCGHSMGHTQCVRNTTHNHLLGDLGHAPAMKIIHAEIASEAVFCHKYHSFSHTCMLTFMSHMLKIDL